MRYWLFLDMQGNELAVIDMKRGWLSKELDSDGEGDVTWTKSSIDEFNDNFIYSFAADGSSFTTPEELYSACSYQSVVIEQADSFESIKLRTMDAVKQAHPEYFI